MALWLGAIAGTAHAASPAPRPSRVTLTREATVSVAPAEQSQEALLRELAQPSFLPPMFFTELLYTAPTPIVGGLGVEVE